jgi:hypothetical protein
MRGAGGPHWFDGVLPGSEDPAARDRAPVGLPGPADLVTELHPRLLTARRGLPALSGIHSHPHAPAREAGVKEERKK